MSKRKFPSLDDLLLRPWCYYCERDFDDDRVLSEHQKAKHFQCTMPSCHRKLNTAGGLRVHLSQVHKEELTEVPNAIEGREDVNIEIFGTVGIPEEIVEARKAVVTKKYKKMQNDFYEKTGNPLPGTGGHQNKRPKIESKEEMMARLRARLAEKGAQGKSTQAAAGAAPQQGHSNVPSPPTNLQTTPTPPAITSYGGPPPTVSMPMASMPMYTHAGGAPQLGSASVPATFPSYLSPMPPSGSPVSYNGAAYSNQTSGGAAFPVPFSAAPPSMPAPGFPPMPGSFAPLGSAQPQQTAMVHPPFPMRPSSSGTGSASPFRPPTLPSKPLHASLPTQDDYEDLFDWAQENAARARAAETSLPPPVPTHPMGPRPNDTSKTPDSHSVPQTPVTCKKPRKGGTDGPTTSHQLLKNNDESFEEMKAKRSSRYCVSEQPGSVPTFAETQGATGPVDDSG